MTGDPSPPRSPRRASVFGHARTPVPPTEPVPDPAPEDLRAALLPVLRGPEQVWAGLHALRLDPRQAEAAHLIVAHREDPVGLLYDRLRTRLVQVLHERGWSRVAVTGPTRGCGASTVAANLALSLARRPSGRTLLMDMDLRHPGLADIFGIPEAGPLRDVLTGMRPAEAHFGRLGRTLALALNDRPEGDSAELLQEPALAETLQMVLGELAPDVTLFDLPPLIDSDDVLAFLPQVQGVLLVVDATRNTAAQIRECEALLRDRSQIIGVVLNRAEDSPARPRPRRWWRR